ncbi:hypothetical protein GCM10012284_20860 [Mangrovihabitans endophyticus]|uniref:Prepilin-type N-terminal cleavage/methylation domain-containing protein n=2 Tax=Mangrovihabitans endophyticus TaxID=1751298 RepID=A0A8J3BX67_9ACTN|nr:hypothetical protein GCM10012284_20860 [Mangrovihabitans endophyticus]
MHRLRRDDSGFSLMEVMVGSAIMSVVMAIATAGLVTMYRTADRTESAALAQTALMASFSKLDTEVRYAYHIGTPYQTGDGNSLYAVDYVIPDPDNVQQCVQLTLPKAGGTLKRTIWPQRSAMSAGATVSAVAEHLESTDGTNPFRVQPSGSDGTNFDRMTLAVTSTVGVATNGATRAYQLKFTALNTVSETIACDK